MLHVLGSTAKTKALLRQQESRMDLKLRIILRRFRQRRGARRETQRSSTKISYAES